MKLITTIALPALLLIAGSQDAISKSNVLPSGPMYCGQIMEQLTGDLDGVLLQSKLSYGRGLDMIVMGLGLNIDNIRFVKEPKATDYFIQANNKAAYAQSLIIAANNGIQLKRSINPEWAMTREQFALALHQAIQGTGQYMTNMMWIIVSDESSFSEGSLAAVQNLIKFNVITLQNGKFRPKSYITTAEANAMVKKAATFIQRSKANQAPAADAETTFTSTPVNEAVNRVVLSRGSKPNSGYQISISKIIFSENKEAVIYYVVKDPEAGNSYMQVIAEPTAETFISSDYKVVLQKEQ
ncbi:hypothetical protein PBAL39_17899 [Pedobacter sp. BAL39]|uniref:protease complex subunit PrcB family protein n=1 Tax=Pedobacter sp. BAL39 TaxID=391596 RepID=UPI0001559DF8|nr:protease complex subunit PrcB family protein [Pedobacter sp. BAL39]EDM36772.1 hypothetical protein PBAL39_17899 [Pedobacter sp. BAL39]